MHIKILDEMNIRIKISMYILIHVNTGERMNAATLLDNIVPTSAFSQGKSAKCFEKVADGSPVIVMKNNAPYRVVVTPTDFARMSELEEDNELLSMALARLEANRDKPSLSASEVYERLGIDMEEVAAMDDVELV